MVVFFSILKREIPREGNNTKHNREGGGGTTLIQREKALNINKKEWK